MSAGPIRIATRASRLALWQAHHVSGLIANACPGQSVELVEVSTVGDRDKSQTLQSLGGFGVFTREVQLALLDGRADLAVHSLKDLPTEVVDGLVLAAVPERGPMFDLLVWPHSKSESGGWNSLPKNARVGTGSPRRRAQLLHQRDDLQLLEVRGNVETRLNKLDDNQYDALVLAEAGLSRLDLLTGRQTEQLRPPLMFPAVGQGALGIECRADDDDVIAILHALNDPATRTAVTAERSLMAELRAGCHAPLGVMTSVEQDQLTLEAVVLSPDGRQRLHAEATGSLGDAEQLGQHAAEKLRQQGAEALVHAAQRDS